MRHIDLNCDLGEGGPHDGELLGLVTSANVCCGAHAGSPEVILDTLRRAASFGVSVGAHPGYPDRVHFGRTEYDPPPPGLQDEVVSQIRTLIGLAEVAGCEVRYLKPHGALYNQACRDVRFAEPVIRAAAQFDLPLVGLPGSELERLAEGRFVPEGFADRAYREDGSLVPRTEPGAFVASPEEAAEQAVRLIESGSVRTLCLHGDNPEAVAFARRLREALHGQGYSFRAFA